MRACLRAAATVLVLAVTAQSAQAHVVVQPATAVAGSAETLSFIVGHGCNGQPTTALRVEFPSGVSPVEPQPKAGWTESVERPSGGGVVVTWRGELSPHQLEAFKVTAQLPKTPGPMAFAATQSCGAATVRWDEAASPSGPRPAHPAPTLTLTVAGAAPTEAVWPASERLPKGVQRLADGGLADSEGRPLYTFDHDTMVGMSHCEADCAQMWPPLLAPKDASPFGAWSLVPREDGAGQWALRDKPLYTYSKDRPGSPAAGTEAPAWKRAK